MAEIVPFRAIRPRSRFAGAVVAPPYDAVSNREEEIIIHKNPLSFLRVLKPEATIPFFSRTPEIIYNEAKKELFDFLKKDIFIREKENSLYIYSESVSGHTQNGVVGLFSCKDFSEGRIRGSEETRSFELRDRTEWIKSTRVLAGPVFLFYKERRKISEIVKEILGKPPLYDFKTEDGVRHTVRRISDRETIRAIKTEFKKINALYVADGNHRTRAASFVQKGKGYFIAAAVPHAELRVFSYDRFVRGEINKEAIIKNLSKFFEIRKIGRLFRPESKGTVIFASKNEIFALKVKKDFARFPDVKILEMAILSQNLLKGKNSVEYVNGTVPPESVETALKKGTFNAAFLLSPPLISEIVSAANSGELLPPKSVWFDPKFRSGLFLSPLDEDFDLESIIEKNEEEFGVW